MSEPDTIAAIATAPGRGAIGVLRISGPKVPELAVPLLGVLPAPRHATFGPFWDAVGGVLDQGLALYFPAPDSFTGEHVLELQGHGGPQVLDLLMKRTLELGCRQARAGEFSERAFLNGKMDIAQAEAVADLIEAGSEAAARAAVRSLAGEFSAHIASLNDKLTRLRMLVEAAIDFPEEEIDFASDGVLKERLSDIFRSFDTIESAAAQGALLREGLNVVIAGKPNAGKSSLMNRLAGDEVAIVTPQPGTTRDVLRQSVSLEGLPVNLIDTAGLRDTHDEVELEGVRRATREIDAADHVLQIVDAAAGEIDPISSGVPLTLVFNKIDLLGLEPQVDLAAQPPRIHVSAKTGAGLDLIRARLLEVAGFNPDAGLFSARRRHLHALSRARQSVQAAADALLSGRAVELFAEDLRQGQRALGEITGEFTSEDLLGEIFSSFCIGK